MILEGRVAIVTGAGSGLGRAHALYLARQGARVVVNDLTQDAADRVAGEIAAEGGEALAIPASVTDEAGVRAMIAVVTGLWNRVDILVNNAGILRDRSFAKMSLDDFRQVVEVHLIGSAVCTHAVWELMRQQKYGRVVMTTSSSGLYGNFGQANYGAAKMALVGLMQTLALEGEKYGIRVNCLAPTAATAMTEGVLSDAQPRGARSGPGQPRPARPGRRGRADPRHPLRRRRPFRLRQHNPDGRPPSRRRRRGRRACDPPLGRDLRPQRRDRPRLRLHPGRTRAGQRRKDRSRGGLAALTLIPSRTGAPISASPGRSARTSG